MKSKNWIDIVILNEFIKYFGTEELIELRYKSYTITEEDSEYSSDIKDRIDGLVQRYRYEVYHIDDEEFDYSLKFFINPYKPLSSKFLASRDKFRSDLKIISYQPCKLIIQDIIQECYLIRELSTMFNNLKTLSIQRIWATLEDLQYLLDNLKHLENLRFMCNDIFRCNEGTIVHAINWPQTLKKLTYGRNQEMIVDNKYDPIPIHPNTMHPDIPTTQHLLLPIHFPNLEVFES
ncbi:hypothetical protein CONCODRAFT_12878 [Conidiobolus coronatus NRRL 28638]|uniref:Uncharacterized protein n=1 Tax=Conidiobolus coronatus (strain ATCC 28846 / CBS 209.66 / NRRL 28638) TaxID=796925 RepID=A0A137NRX1_CONC2|nr:hypothetical protein CONCODRAFT_12878 [Conidiobolus coronatus NRRL 28638]|eukprot:KXN65519.1 hypothetical protein CONCODRAFT_12878 [Conidiobolus coronatus NRRL 28638]